MNSRTHDSTPFPTKLDEVPLDQFLIRQELPVLTEIVSANEADAIPELSAPLAAEHDIPMLAAQIAEKISAQLVQDLPAMIESILRQQLVEPSLPPLPIASEETLIKSDLPEK